MRLTSISIRNHSRVADLDVQVRRHAVIVGANDVGKTSILRLLNLALGTSAAGLYQALSPADLRETDLPMVTNLTLGGFSDAERTLFPSEISVAQGDETESLQLQLRVELDPSDDEAVAIHRWFPDAGHERAPTREQLESFGWRYLRASRANATNVLDGPASAVRTLLESADLGGQRNALVSLLTQFNEELGESEPIVDLLERVAKHLSRAMPKDVHSTDFAVRSTADPEKDVLGNVTMFLNRGDHPVPLHEQSDGVRQLMAMTLFDLAEGKANMLAIDEPELHLHPASQRTISDLLSGDGNQKVLVTHSPFVVQRFEPAEIITIDRDGHAHQILDSHLTEVEKQRANWWSPRLLEALTSRFILVVEGAADRIIVEGAARASEVDLDRLGAVVLELDGADKFPNVYQLLGPRGFGVTLLGLVDEQESNRWVGTVGGKPAKVVGRHVFISKMDLEDEYARALTGPGAAEVLIRAGVCTESAILMSAGVTRLEDVPWEKVAAYCRKDKVVAASAIGAALTPQHAKAIESVQMMLLELQCLALI